MSDLRVSVLGASGTYPGPLGPCSSYLVEAQGYRLLLDAGHGSLATLHRFCNPRDIDAVLVSHRHPDHCADLLGLFYARMFAGDGDPTAEPPAIGVYAPEGVAGAVRAPMTASAAAAFDERLVFHPVGAGDHLELGPLSVSLFAGGIGRTDFPTSDHPTLLSAIRDQLLSLPEATRVLPGHGPETTIGQERATNPFLQGMSGG